MAQGSDSQGGAGMEQDGTGMGQGGGVRSTLPGDPGSGGLARVGGLCLSCVPLAIYFTAPVSRGVRELGQPNAGLGSCR